MKYTVTSADQSSAPTTTRTEANVASDSLVVIGRSPLLPLHVAYGLFKAESRFEYLKALIAEDKRIILALQIASPSLTLHVIRDLADNRTTSRAIDKACAYIIRMASRSTPFGLFASVGEIDVTTRSHEFGLKEELKSRARIDNGYLQRKILEIESDSRIRRRLSYTLNDLTVERGNRLIIFDTLPTTYGSDPDAMTDFTQTSIRSGASVQHIKNILRNRWLKFDSICESLCETFAIEQGNAANLIDQLWRAGLILSNLRISPTSDILAHVADLSMREVPTLSKLLRRAQSALKALDDRPLQSRRPTQYAVIDSFLSRHDSRLESTIQVDLKRDYSGALPVNILDDTFEFGSLMLQLSPRRELAEAREHFRRKYEGQSRLVPVLDFVTSAPRNRDIFQMESVVDAGWEERRNAIIAEKVLSAVRDGSIEWSLDEKELEELKFPSDFEKERPNSQELLVEIHAQSYAEVLAGSYIIAGSSHVGVTDYAPSFGRFSDMLSSQALQTLTESATRAANKRGVVSADLSFWPIFDRFMNVVVRQPIRGYELALGVPNTPESVERINIDDVYVGLDSRGFYLWSGINQRRLELSQGHVFASPRSPALVKFLTKIRNDGKRRFHAFDRGGMSRSPFFPRVRTGRFVLSKAKWVVPTVANEARPVFEERVRSFCDVWRMPPLITLVDADRKLLLDLSTDLGLDLLYEQSRKSTGWVVIEEFLPSTFGTWVDSEHGSHTLEILATSIRGEHEEIGPVPSVTHNEAVRVLPPGEWLFFCLYCNEADSDHILTDGVHPEITRLISDGLVGRWFFLRYRDPDFHIRIRFNVTEPDNHTEVLRRLNLVFTRMVQSHAIDKFTLATYFRELERYGGAKCIELFEEMFHQDSEIAVTELKRRFANLEQRARAGLTTVDILISGLLTDSSKMSKWLAVKSGPLRKLPAPVWDDVRSVRARIQAVNRAALEYDKVKLLWSEILSKDTLVDQALYAALESIIHMHWNRFGIHDGAEREMRSAVAQLYRGLNATGFQAAKAVSVDALDGNRQKVENR